MSRETDLLSLMKDVLIPEAEAIVQALPRCEFKNKLTALVSPYRRLSLTDYLALYESISNEPSMPYARKAPLIHLVAALYIHNSCYCPEYTRQVAQPAYEFLRTLTWRADFDSRDLTTEILRQASCGINQSSIEDLLWWLQKLGEFSNYPELDNCQGIAETRLRLLACKQTATQDPEQWRTLLETLILFNEVPRMSRVVDSLKNDVGEKLIEYILTNRENEQLHPYFNCILNELTEYHFPSPQLTQQIHKLAEENNFSTDDYSCVIDLAGNPKKHVTVLSVDRCHRISQVHSKNEFHLIEILHCVRRKCQIKVWKAVIKKSGALVAVKSYSSLDEEILDTFYCEAEHLANLSELGCTQFLKFYGCFKDQKLDKDETWHRFHIVMQLCNKTLQEEIEARQQSKRLFTTEELLEAIQQLVEGFTYLESRNIFHQDIKPDNIFLDITEDSPCLYKIADFNVSKSTDPDLSTSVSVHNQITGTDGFFSPELQQAWDKCRAKAGPPTLCYSPSKSDVFSLGLTFLNMASLESINSMNRVENQEELKARIRYLLVPKDVKRLLSAMLQFNPKKRPQFKELLPLLPRTITKIVD